MNEFEKLIERRSEAIRELHLTAFPVTLGAGRKLFGDRPDKPDWKLTRATTCGEGVLVTIFERDRTRTS